MKKGGLGLVTAGFRLVEVSFKYFPAVYCFRSYHNSSNPTMQEKKKESCHKCPNNIQKIYDHGQNIWKKVKKSR